MKALTIPKRETRRSRVFLEAEVAGEGRLIQARIRDISRSGALIEAENAPSVGAKCVLTCGDSMLDARVAWADKCWFGVEFATPLAMGFLMDQTGARLKVSAPRNYRSTEEPLAE